jgi:hypothetical protein
MIVMDIGVLSISNQYIFVQIKNWDIQFIKRFACSWQF